MKVDGSLKSLLQGVSQQPPRDRLAGQCTEQINQRADPIDGNARRQPTDLVGSLGDSTGARAWHDFEMQDQNHFIVGIHDDGHISVADLNANAYTATVSGSSAAYLATEGTLKFYTDEDENRTFILNTGVKAAMLTATMSYANSGSGKPTMGIIQILGGAYARHYVINVNGAQKALYLPPDGTTGSDINKVQTGFIAARLTEALTGTPGTTSPDGTTSSLVTSGYMAASPWIVHQVSDLILITNTAGTAFTLSVSDDEANINAKGMTTQVDGIEDLPRIAPKGYVVRVASNVDPLDDLWYQFLTEDASISVGDGFGQPGYWAETVAPDTAYALDPATMPHILTYSPDTQTFDLAETVWGHRTVGTTKSNPQPSFVGLPLNDVFSAQSRLGFVSGKNFILSVTNDYLNFWFSSQQTKASTDPIDISSTSENGANLAAVVEHNKDLVVFSEAGAQFIFTGTTGDDAALVETTTFEAALTAAPANAGKTIFFATKFGRYTGIREFFTEPNGISNDAQSITDHVKTYIVGAAQRIVSSPNYGIMFVLTDTDIDTVYQYQYIWSDTTKVQSAWSKLIFHDDVAYMYFVQDRIYVVLHIDGAYYLERMGLDIIADDSMGFPIFLDSRFDVFSANTQFALPYDWLHDKTLVCVQSDGCPNPGFDVPIKSIVLDTDSSQYVVTLTKDMQGGHIVVGAEFKSQYRPTMPLVKDQDGIVVATGHLRVRDFLVVLLDTGHIEGQVLADWGNGPVIAFNGRTVGSVHNTVGQVHLSNGQFQVPFRLNTDDGDIELSSSSYLPMAITDIDWVGQYQKRGKRISTGG